jgi:curved DNA-binding protein CbpA
MLPDYYQILGVRPTAKQTEIGKAFRQRAVECHPDRGGSHEAMKRVLEAWEILSNPETRSRYDAARSKQNDAAAQAAAKADAARAAASAANYPRSWSDFVEAKYGKTEKIWGVSFPTVSNSRSGAIFIVVGAGFGLFFIAFALSALPFIWQRQNFFVLAMIHVVCGAAPGAWLAWWLHSSIQREILKPNRAVDVPISQTEESAQRKVINCPHCGTKLRLPISSHVLSVTCPTCRANFDHQNEAVFEGPSSAGFIAAGYICGILALFILPPAFALAGFMIGLVNVSKNRIGHGVAQIVISVSCGILGFLIGMMAG